ncbi:MAG: ABC transporter ATP-binding protein [Coriobacteriales bacterium]
MVNAEKRLVAKDVRRVFRAEDGSELVALQGFNLEAEHGELIALIGPSGCGKSTFLRLVAGLDEHQGGSLQYGGEDIHGPSHDRGFVFQETNLYPWLTVEANIAFGLKARGVYKEQRHRVQEMVDLMGLGGFEKSYPHQISGGMAARVAIAQTLVQDPGVVLLDEPLSALDAFTRAIIQDEILKMRDRFRPIILMVTHDIEEAVYMADRVVVLTPRPGTNAGEVRIDLGHPRDRLSSEFISLRHQVMDMLDFA